MKFSKWLMFFMPIVVLFYEENGLSEEYIFYLHALYSIIIVIFEIPSGYLADSWGRKNTLVTGAILGFVGFFTYSVSYSLQGFIIAEIALGIGQSLISGSDSAMLYDSLYDMNKEKQYIKKEGRLTALGNYAEAFAGLIGPLLAFGTFRTTYYFQTGIAFFGIPAALLLIEPVRHIQLAKNNPKQILSIIKYALLENQALRYSILFSAVIGASTLTMAWYAQIIFNHIDLKKEFFGMWWAILNLTVGVGSWFANAFIKKFGMRKISFFIFILLTSMYILSGLALNYLVFLFLITFYLVRGIATPTLKGIINVLTTSDRRATVLSVRNLIIRIVFSILSPMIGYFNQRMGLSEALILSGIIFLVGSLVVFPGFIRKISPHMKTD